MRKNFVISIIIITFCVIPNFAANEKEFAMVRIDLGLDHNLSISKILDLDVDITCYNGRENYIEAIVDKEQRLAIEKFGLKITPIIEDLMAYTERLRNEGYFEPFHTFAEMLEEMEQVVANHPDIASLHDIGDSYNKVHGLGGYDIWALKISDHVDIEDDSEADALFMANMHAREIITPEIIMYYIHFLIDRYGSDPYVSHLVNNREIWLIPTFNPDGHEYVFTGDINAGISQNPIWWRKNMRDNNNNGIFDYYGDGVDLNRNFGYMWGYDNRGSSGSPSSETYRGPEAFSEPESQAIRDFVQAHDFVVSLSYHSYGRMWLYPWSYVAANPPEPDISSFIALADSCVAYNGYEAGNYFSGTIYQVNGDTDDWLYGEKGIFAFTPEVGHRDQGMFWPDTLLIMPLVLENLGPNLYMTYAAGEEPIVRHNRLSDSENISGPYVVTATILPPILLTESVPLDSSSYKVVFSTTGTAPFDSVILAPTDNQDEYTAELPGLGNDGTIYYFVTASDTIGRTGTSPRGAPAALDSFRIANDTKPPSIVHEPLLYQPPSISNLEFSAEVTDNLGIDAVWLYLQCKSFDILEAQLQHLGENKYHITLDLIDIAPGDSFYYRIKAIDASENRNISYLPEEGWYSFGIFVSDITYNFETDSVCVTHDDSDWEWGIPTVGPDSAHSGQLLWATRLNDEYSNWSDSELNVPEYTLKPELSQAAFQFWHWYETELSNGSIWDGGNIKISVDRGTYQVIEPRDGYDGVIDTYNGMVGGESGFGGPAGGNPYWQREIIDLTEYIGHSVRLRFHFGSDDNTTESGWYVDDMEFLIFPPDEPIVQVEDVGLPHSFNLSQNYPNPFNSRTKLDYQLPWASSVHIAIYNQIGQRIKLLYGGHQLAGQHSVDWDAKDNAGNPCVSGIYFCRMDGSSVSIVRKMLYLK